MQDIKRAKLYWSYLDSLSTQVKDDAPSVSTLALARNPENELDPVTIQRVKVCTSHSLSIARYLSIYSFV